LMLGVLNTGLTVPVIFEEINNEYGKF